MEDAKVSQAVTDTKLSLDRNAKKVYNISVYLCLSHRRAVHRIALYAACGEQIKPGGKEYETKARMPVFGHIDVDDGGVDRLFQGRGGRIRR